MELKEMKEIKDMMDFANEVHECMVGIVKYCRDGEYSPEVMKSAIESIHKLLGEKERNSNG